MLAYLTFLVAATPAVSQIGTTEQPSVNLPPPVINVPPPRSFPARATPRTNPGAWVNSSDYPPLALLNQWEGTTGFHLDISPDGRVMNCTITATSGYSMLDQMTCSNLKRRGRFQPALDEKGQPIVGGYASRVRWVLPNRDLSITPAPAGTIPPTGKLSERGPNKAAYPIGMFGWLSFEPFYAKLVSHPVVLLKLDVDSAGKVMKCSAKFEAKVKESDRLRKYRAELCLTLKARAAFLPATDFNSQNSDGQFRATTAQLQTAPP